MGSVQFYSAPHYGRQNNSPLVDKIANRKKYLMQTEGYLVTNTTKIWLLNYRVARKIVGISVGTTKNTKQSNAYFSVS